MARPGPKPIPLLVKFWAGTKGGDENECWPWQRATDGKGYGKIGHCDRLFQAHRIAYELFVGPIPADLLVCHKCDNPPCVNPRHLFLGTYLDNIRDMWIKGRQSPPPRNNILPPIHRGQDHSKAKLTAAQITEIKSRPSIRGNRIQLAVEFGVTPACISKIVLGRTWRQLGDV